MKLTTPELENLMGVSRYQLSRYFHAGRLRKTAAGKWDAASAASVIFKSLRWELTRGSECDREIALVRGKHEFKRCLREVADKRRLRDPKCAVNASEIDAAVATFTQELIDNAKREGCQ